MRVLSALLVILETRAICALVMPEFRPRNRDCCEAWDPKSQACVLCAAGCYNGNSDESSSVECLSCKDGTYTSYPNVLTHCLSCTHCHTHRGLVMKQNCTTVLDTICTCEPHTKCAVFNGHHCDLCLHNWTCSWNQELKQGGAHTEAVTRILICVSVFALCTLCLTGFFTCKSCIQALPWPGG
uniref:tumor necrosis factor receptor superfamily member 14-like n=1 Tax=Myxine glutinosa TaxID=7769 RepID=UPI00358E09D4